MLICPVCHREGVEQGECLWRDCSPRPKPNYTKFKQSIKLKKDIGNV